MAKRRAESGEEKGNWLDTYADMVTLLLCFSYCCTLHHR